MKNNSVATSLDESGNIPSGKSKKLLTDAAILFTS